MVLIELLGWIGAICATTANIPNLIKTIQNGNADHLPLSFLLILMTGLISMSLYLFFTNRMSNQLTTTYVVNILVTGTTLWYKIK